MPPLRLLAALALALAALSARAAPEPLRVVLDDNYPPYAFRDADGQFQGILKDLWDLWQQRSGIAADLRPMDWAKARATMESGRADVIDTLFKTEARQKVYDFSPPYAAIEVALFFHQSIGAIVDAASAKGFAIGVKDGDACIDHLGAQGLGDFKRYASYAALVDAAARQEIRVFCIDLPPAYYFLNRAGIAEQFRHTAPLYVGQFHWAVAKGRHDLQQRVAAGFARISAAERQAIEARWLGQRLSPGAASDYARPLGYGLLALGLGLALLLAWSWLLRRQVAARTAELSLALDTLRASDARVKQLLEEQRLIFDNAHVGILLLQNRRILKCNQRIAEMFGFAGPAELEGQSTALFYCSPQQFAAAGEQGYRQLAEDGAANFETEMCRRDGTRIWVVQSGRPLDPQRVLEAASIWVYTDVSARRQAEADLRVAAAAFESQEGMLVTDAQTRILRINKAFTDTTGYSADEVLGKTPRILKSGRHDAAFYREMWQAIERTGAWQGEIWDRRKDGTVFPKWLTISAVKDAAGTVTHYIGTHYDITERKRAEEKIKELAFFDQLTGLPNRTLLHDRLKQTLAANARSGNYGALLFIDLDNFKTLNDTLGHAQGDQLLRQVARRLTQAVREGDTVARLGGDEFILVLPTLSADAADSAATAEMIAEKILAALNQPFPLGEAAHHVTASIGVTVFAGDGAAFDELMKQADLAMYKAKDGGRNLIRFFDPALETAVKERAAWEDDLRQALAGGQFLLHYQPQIAGQRQLTGAEALLRWRHPTRGMVSPADFIPLAEETGLIVGLGHWVLERACRQLVAWAADPALAHLSIAVNVSARQFRQDDFVDQVTAVLKASGADPQRLKLELTESLLVENVQDIIDKMFALKARGVGFALDDFGTGYSSLAYLKRLPLDQLKIDQSFVRDVLIDPNDASIARTVIALAQSLGLGVIAEGVETQAQLDFLVAAGCHAYQGYFFARPLPPEEFEAFARRT